MIVSQVLDHKFGDLTGYTKQTPLSAQWSYSDQQYNSVSERSLVSTSDQLQQITDLAY